MNDRSGVAFRAARVEPAVAAGQGKLTERRWSPSDREGGGRSRR